MQILPRWKNNKSAKVDIQELGLVSGFILGRHFFGVEDLHYGYWPEGLPVDIDHLPQAQRNYSDFLLRQVPPSVKAILDVGCGTGSVARRLLDSGYHVDCVSPSPFLTTYAAERVGKNAELFLNRFEELDITRKYDMVMFCESFQYIPPRVALEKSLSLLAPGGYVLISDFFRSDVPGKSPIGGGHRWTVFQDQLMGLPLECVHDLDITKETAPTLKLVNDAMFLAIRPIWEMTKHTFGVHYPRSTRFFQWALRKKLERIETKTLAGTRDEKAFAQFKSYRSLLYRKCATAPVALPRAASAA